MSNILGRCGKVGVVGSGRILNGDENTVILGATLVKVVKLEVERFLGEAVTICEVVHHIENKEGVRAGRIEVRWVRGVEVVVVFVVKFQNGGGLCSGLLALESNDIVAAAVRRVSSSQPYR